MNDKEKDGFDVEVNRGSWLSTVAELNDVPVLNANTVKNQTLGHKDFRRVKSWKLVGCYKQKHAAPIEFRTSVLSEICDFDSSN